MEFNPDLEETYKLLGIFSAEVWSMIFDNLDTAVDFQNISNSSTLFHQVLQPKRTVILFKDVVKVLVQFCERSKLLTELSTTWDLGTMFSLRLVCRTWTKGLDHILQTTDTKKGAQKLLKLGWYSCVTKFDSSENILEFEKHFKDTHHSTGRNPIITRYIVVHLSSNIYNSAYFCDRLVQFLKSYGVYIWTCFIIKDEFQGMMAFHRYLPLILQHLPNLKMLLFDSDNYEPLTKSQVALTKRFMSQTPLPVLRSLTLINNRGLPLPILEGLVRTSPQLDNIETLGFEKAVFASKELHKHIKVCLEQVPNLTTFSTSISSLEEWMEFKSAKLNCKIVKLGISFRVDIPWASIFQKLEQHFAGSLEILTLCLPESRGSDKGVTLKLPILKSLYIKFQKCESLDFLLSIKDNLESLTVGYDNFPKNADHVKTAVRLQEFKDAYDPENVRTMFPNLRTFTINPVDQND